MSFKNEETVTQRDKKIHHLEEVSPVSFVVNFFMIWSI